MQQASEIDRDRARNLGIAPGIFPPGPLNAITDVQGIMVGHTTVIQGEDIRTGATAILPHADNIFQNKVPAGIAVGNGYGKLMGSTQIRELGEIETPIVLTDAPLSDRNLTRLAQRALFGLARTGSSFSNGSGDYAIAFSVAKGVRRTPERRRRMDRIADLPNAAVSPLFQAAIEATEEAIVNSLFMATTIVGYRGFVGEAIPLDRVMDLLGASAGKTNE